jgi:SAM-dependent methyltransferase
MGAYRALAEYYDELTADVPYGAFADYYERIFAENGLSVRSILDAACGTGTLTWLLQERGYDMIGADASADMLTPHGQGGAGSGRFFSARAGEAGPVRHGGCCVCSLDGVNKWSQALFWRRFPDTSVSGAGRHLHF